MNFLFGDLNSLIQHSQLSYYKGWKLRVWETGKLVHGYNFMGNVPQEASTQSRPSHFLKWSAVECPLILSIYLASFPGSPHNTAWEWGYTSTCLHLFENKDGGYRIYVNLVASLTHGIVEGYCPRYTLSGSFRGGGALAPPWSNLTPPPPWR